MKYNLLNTDSTLSMSGKVRTREKCPTCRKSFFITEETDIFCPSCNTRPNTFYIFIYHKKVKYRISRDRDGYILDSYGRARRLLERIRGDIDAGVFNINDYLHKEIEQFRIKNILPKWIDNKKDLDLAPSYIREVKRYAKIYNEKLGDMDARELRNFHIDDFFGELPKGLSIKTKKNIMDTLKDFLNWLHNREILLRMPYFKTISPPEPEIIWISKEDQLRVLACVDDWHKPIISFLIYHPVRTGEARALKRKDFDLKNMSIHICRTFSLKELRARKGKKPYYLPISKHFDLKVLENKMPETFVFSNKGGRPYTAEGLRRIWKRACKKAGITYIPLYNATRHSIASQSLNDGVHLGTISQALGHSTLEMTRKYARMAINKLRVVVDGAQVVQITDFSKSN